MTDQEVPLGALEHDFESGGVFDPQDLKSKWHFHCLFYLLVRHVQAVHELGIIKAGDELTALAWPPLGQFR